MVLEQVRLFIADVIAKTCRFRVLRSITARINRERRLVRDLSRLGRGESLDLAAITNLKKNGSRFAAYWRRYRLAPSLGTESRLMSHLKKLVGAELALSFFVRSEALIPRCLSTEFRDFVEAELCDVPEEALLEVLEFDGATGQVGRLVGIDSSGMRSVDVEIRMRGKDALYRLDDVMVFGGSGIIRKGLHAIWPNYVFEAGGDGLYPWDSVLVEHTSGRALLRHNFLEPPYLIIDEALSLLDSSARHFGHFAWGLVPRLRVLFRNTTVSSGLKILVGDETPSSVIDFLTLWGLKRRLVMVPKGSCVQVEHLYMPSPLKYFPDLLPVTAKVESQSRALASAEFDFLFSLRRKAPRQRGGISLLRTGSGEGPRRKCLNHDEVAETLAKAGLVSLTAEIKDTVKLYRAIREASLIVVDDGSISANILLAGVSGARIIFLTHPGVSGGGHLAWWTQGYLAFKGNEVESMHVNVRTMDRTSDWWVDCVRLRELILGPQAVTSAS